MQPGKTIRTCGFLLLLLLLIAALLVGGCVNGPRPVWRLNYFKALEKGTIENEILRYETDIINNPDNPQSAASYFYLAMLHAHYNNPAPDYARALSMCEKYLSLNPEGYRTGEAQYLKTLLRQIAKAAKDREEYGKKVQKLEQTAEKLQEENEALLQENHNLKAAIEKLEKLDLRLEEQRRDL
ncbi:MAG: hypothetical protein M8357_13610 [Desulfobulbaceae bacterium]|nr:hypothetical protein [Desulfobulbaceae bacterium]